MVFQVIIEFLEMLNSTEEESVNNNTKLFASQMTTESLRVTLVSVIDIITWLHDKGIRYVLTVKLNQDPLEVARIGILYVEITIFWLLCSKTYFFFLYFSTSLVC